LEAAVFSDVIDRPIAVRMIELRRRREGWFKRSPHPDKRPGYETWLSPEFAILSIAKSFAMLRQDGLSEADAIARIDQRRNLGVWAAGTTSLETYIKRVLQRYAPQYLEFGDRLLREALALVQGKLASRYGAPRSPAVWSESSLAKERLSPEEIRRELATDKRPLLFPRHAADEDMTQFLVRLDDSDEIWRWRSSPEMWRMMMGRGGLTLVRNNRAIATVMTVMN
jgi:hypothetical protein